jgi:hypothetical protein
VLDVQDVRISTTERPQRVELDRITSRTGSAKQFRELVSHFRPQPHIAYNWPFLDQVDLARIVAVAPALWYSGPQGPVLGVARRRTISRPSTFTTADRLLARNPHDLNATARAS